MFINIPMDQEHISVETVSYLLAHCVLDNLKTQNTTLLDKLVGRTNIEKTLKQCHLSIIKQEGLRNFKVNGRYAFNILFHCTEFFSVVFSLLSLFQRLFYFFFYLRKQTKTHFIGRFYIFQFYIGCIMWLFSTLLHMHETEFYRNMDYFLALLFIEYSFYMTVVRIMILKQMSFRKIERYSFMLLLLLFFLYIIDIYVMIFINFNRHAHKLFSGFLITLTFIMWLYLYSKIKNLKYSKYLLLNSIIIGFSIIVEYSDIPPFYYIIDSHALWHLLGSLLEYSYFKFLFYDIVYLNSKEKNE